MDRATLATLSLPERQLVEQTQVAALAGLDEDETAELLIRVRRTRTKYTKLYRRQASAQVSSDAARGAASAKNRRTRDKAEVFEDALARVSRRLAALARQQADELGDGTGQIADVMQRQDRHDRRERARIVKRVQGDRREQRPPRRPRIDAPNRVSRCCQPPRQPPVSAPNLQDRTRWRGQESLDEGDDAVPPRVSSDLLHSGQSLASTTARSDRSCIRGRRWRVIPG